MAELIAVLGMHRSGTSALTEMLVNAGAWFGDRSVVAGSAPKKPLGLVERTDFLALTEPALRAVGCRWHDVFLFEPKWNDQVALSFQERFRLGILTDLMQRRPSVLKDPRLSLLLPLFLPAMPKTTAVMIVRHPLEVAMSLRARNKFSIPFGVALWEAYNRHALRSLEGLQCILVQHRSLMRDASACISEVISELHNFGAGELNAARAIAAANINPMLHRQRARSLDDQYPLEKGQREFWKVFRNARRLQDLPIASISPESLQLLEAHHAEIERRRAHSASSASCQR